MAAAGRIFLLWLILSGHLVQADMCFRSVDKVRVDGMTGLATAYFMWSDQGNVLDEIRFDGERFKAGSDLRCGNLAPIACRLSDDGGAFRLVFEGNKARLISTGFKVSILSGQPNVRVKRGLQTIVHELVQMTDAQCQLAFPVRRKIEVFPDRPENPAVPPPMSPAIILR